MLPILVSLFATDVQAAPLSPDTVVAAALSHDPALTVADAAVHAAEAEHQIAAGLRYDPSVEARIGFLIEQHEVAFSQPVSISGERRAARQAAEAGLRAAVAERDRRALEVAADARRRLAHTITAEAAVRRAEARHTFAAALRITAEKRVTAGEAPTLDGQLARLEEAGAAADRLSARRDVLAAREALAATTGLGVDVELGLDPMEAAPQPVAGSVTVARPDALAELARHDQAEANLRREKSAALPPVELGIWAQVQNVGVEAGPQGVVVPAWSWKDNAGWSVGPSVSFTLPSWDANRAGIARAEGERRTAASELAAGDARRTAEVAGNPARRAALAATLPADPSADALAALAGVDPLVVSGEISAADGMVLRTRILDAWGRAGLARAEAAAMTIDLALAESWQTLVPAWLYRAF